MHTVIVGPSPIHARSRALRAVALAVAVGVACASLTTAAANASDPRSPLGSFGTFQLDGYCGFPVEVTQTRANQYIIHESTAADGTTTLNITGDAKATVTNVTTGKSLSYTISGPGTVVLSPDGGFSIDATGPNLLWTAPENSYPGVPTLSYTTGHVTVDVDASGMTTGYSLVGRGTDVCAALAA